MVRKEQTRILGYCHVAFSHKMIWEGIYTVTNKLQQKTTFNDELTFPKS